MATTWAKVSYDLTKEDQITGVQADDGTVTYTAIQTWIAVTDQTSKGNAVDAMNATDGTNSVPTLGSSISISGNTFNVTQSRPKRAGPYSWEIQVQSVWTYTPPKSTAKYNVSVKFGGQDYTQDAFFDKDNNPIINSAGQSFDPTLKKTYSDEKISIGYSTTVEQSATFATIRGYVNSTPVTLSLPGISRSFDTRTLLCDSADQSGSVPLANGTATWSVSLNFTCRTDGYMDKVLDQGFYCLDHTTNEIVQITDKNGINLSAPALLDGSGNVLAPGGTPVYKTFKIESEADFTSAFSGLGG